MKRKADKEPSAFDLFVHEWQQVRRSSLRFKECVHLAGPAWKLMTLEERQPYINKSLELRSRPNSKGIRVDIGPGEKHLQMQQRIEALVHQSVQRNELAGHKYYFLMVNYFTKDIYTPAELAGAQFSLQEGVQNIYHTLVNPGVGFHSSKLEMQEHANATHQLPVPPNALGNGDVQGIYADIKNFVRSQPVFTPQEHLDCASGALRFLKLGVESKLRVYPIEYLFHMLKRATCEAGKLPIPEANRLTNVSFNLNDNELLPNISCAFHEQLDIAKYCAKSNVTSWGFTFAEHMCSDLGIEMLPNRHRPQLNHNFTITETLPVYEQNSQPSPNLDQIGEETTNQPQIKKEWFDEDEFNPDVVDTLNSLDLDNIFEDEDCLEFEQEQQNNISFGSAVEDGEIISDTEDIPIIPPMPPIIAEELIFMRRHVKSWTPETIHSDIRTNSQTSFEDDLREAMRSVEIRNASLKRVSKQKRRESQQRKCLSPKGRTASTVSDSFNIRRFVSRSRSRSRESHRYFRKINSEGKCLSREERCRAKSPEIFHRARFGPSTRNPLRSRSRSRSRDHRSFNSESRNRVNQRSNSRNRTEHGHYLRPKERNTTKSPPIPWSSASRSISREGQCPRNVEHKIYRTDNRLERRSPKIRNRSRSPKRPHYKRKEDASPQCGFSTKTVATKRSDSPKRMRGHQAIFDRSPNRVIRERDPIESPPERNPSQPVMSHRYVEKDFNRPASSQDISISDNMKKFADEICMAPSNIILPNDTLGKSNPQLMGNQSISTIINRQEVKSNSRSAVMPIINHNKLHRRHNYDPSLRTFYKPGSGDYGQQPPIRPHNLGHRLGEMRSNYMFTNNLRNCPQDQQPVANQMVYYSQEHFPAYGNNRQTWENYEAPQLKNGYGQFVPRYNY